MPQTFATTWGLPARCARGFVGQGGLTLLTSPLDSMARAARDCPGVELADG